MRGGRRDRGRDWGEDRTPLCWPRGCRKGREPRGAGAPGAWERLGRVSPSLREQCGPADPAASAPCDAFLTSELQNREVGCSCRAGVATGTGAVPGQRLPGNLGHDPSCPAQPQWREQTCCRGAGGPDGWRPTWDGGGPSGLPVVGVPGLSELAGWGSHFSRLAPETWGIPGSRRHRAPQLTRLGPRGQTLLLSLSERKAAES